MEFDAESYPTIREACNNRRAISFAVPVDATGYFTEENAPSEWQICPPMGSSEAYNRILYQPASDLRGTVTALEVRVHVDGGRIEYKAAEPGKVLMRISWPDAV